MRAKTHHIVKQLFQADSLADVSVAQLEELVEAHPYFGAARFLLLQKLQDNDSGSFNDQAGKAALYFADPLRMRWMLRKSNAEDVPVEHALPVVEEPVIVETAQQAAVPADFAPSDEAIGRSVLNQVEQANAVAEAGALAFEPYHTVDYFASQGIKFVQEANPNDKLGKQLKSFTEWLKVMKKLPQKSKIADVNEKEAAVIEKDAAHSIEGKEVVTETMAEVLAKQGKTEDAIEVYQKLSLLFPEKNAYFAARIEHLKVH